ncbi:hypothetical protein GCM10011574_17370 [Microbispora bryophytorum]|uniref:2'-5' RNA ligase family protein n=1 Tax=Microbispora bryophytorum TaxID=1460882 RepID=A0A8H9LCF3_9ACTN|nr:hypothetical protein GCM10011574_17370 [Microbispora bryophytorum]
MLPPEGLDYWHVLLGDHPEVRAIASEAHRRLAGFTGLDPVSYEGLHLTTIIVGLTDEITEERLVVPIAEALERLADMQPITRDARLYALPPCGGRPRSASSEGPDADARRRCLT